MTIFESIKSMNIDEFVEWICRYDDIDGYPWLEWFSKKYCAECKPEKVYAPYLGHDIECSWCELHGKCKFFLDMDDIPNTKQTIKMWLECEADRY